MKYCTAHFHSFVFVTNKILLYLSDGFFWHFYCSTHEEIQYVPLHGGLLWIIATRGRQSTQHKALIVSS